MATNIYKVTDTKEDKVIFEKAYSHEIVKYFDGKFTTVSRYAEMRILYQKRYKFELMEVIPKGPNRKRKDGYESISQIQDVKKLESGYTNSILYNRCLIYKIGDRVFINISVKDEDGKSYITKQISGTVIEKYQYHLVIKTDKGIQESFTYKDIVLSEVIEHIQGKSKK